jgi:hypothetical protein
MATPMVATTMSAAVRNQTRRIGPAGRRGATSRPMRSSAERLQKGLAASAASIVADAANGGSTETTSSAVATSEKAEHADMQ